MIDSDEGAWHVSDVTKCARYLVESGFPSVWVRGEVTGLKKYRSGHWYFTLRDVHAQVRCVMWRTDNRRLPSFPDEGTEVFVDARPTVWEERGEFRLTVKQLIPTDAGVHEDFGSLVRKARKTSISMPRWRWPPLSRRCPVASGR